MAAELPGPRRLDPKSGLRRGKSSRNPAGPGIVFDKHDFADMVASDNGWKKASSRISVLDLNAVGIVEAYSDIPGVLSMIARNKTPIVVSGSVVYTNKECNIYREGITNDVGFEREFVLQMRRWRQLGGRVDYLAMDVPLFGGHIATQKECHFSIEEVAGRAATTVNLILQEFPSAKIIDADGPGWVPINEWVPQLEQFVRSFNNVSRQPIQYISLDMHWTDDWHSGYKWVSATREITERLHKLGLKVGLIINADNRHVQSADGTVITDRPVDASSWMEGVRDHLRLVHDAALPLDFLAINSWTKHPEKNLPETDPIALMSLVNFCYELWPR